MRRVYLIEPVVGLYSFSMAMVYPTMEQYIYRRLWEQHSGAPFPTGNGGAHCAGNATNLTSLDKEVQKEASLFMLNASLCLLFPSLLSSVLLMSYSDHCGRKVAILPPLVGGMLVALFFCLVSSLSLSLNFLLVAFFLDGLLGGPTALSGGCFAYVADRTEQGGVVGVARGVFGGGGLYVAGEGGSRGEGAEGGGGGGRSGGEGGGARTIRMAGLDIFLGALAGLASLLTGFFIERAGFTWPFLTTTLILLLAVAYVLCVLRESLIAPPFRASAEAGPSHLLKRDAVIRQLQGVYLLFAASTRRRNAGLGLMLTAFFFYKLSFGGSFSLFILYELSEPLCWSEVLVGYGSALQAVISLGSFMGVAVLSLCLREGHIVLLGLLSASVGLLMTAFAKTTLLMFLVRLPLLLSLMPSSVLRSMLSKIVLSSEHGALFACVAFMEILSVGMGFIVFNSTYAATVSWFPGFAFLLASSLILIPATLIGVVLCLGLDKKEDTDMLMTEQEAETDSDRDGLQLPHWGPS